MKKTAHALQQSLSTSWSPPPHHAAARSKPAAADVLVSLTTIMSSAPGTRPPPPVHREAKRYADRPSPPFPASSAAGMAHVGNDGKRWVSVALAGSKADTIAESPKVVYTWRRLAV